MNSLGGTTQDYKTYRYIRGLRGSPTSRQPPSRLPVSLWPPRASAMIRPHRHECCRYNAGRRDRVRISPYHEPAASPLGQLVDLGGQNKIVLAESTDFVSVSYNIDLAPG